jgi:hypothetical protein
MLSGSPIRVVYEGDGRYLVMLAVAFCILSLSITQETIPNICYSETDKMRFWVRGTT